MDKKQYTVTDEKIKTEVAQESNRDLIRHVSAILLSLSAFLGVLGYQFDWLTQESINAFVVVLYAVAGFGYTAFEIYKNKFGTQKGKKQNELLKKNNLKK